ncbi:DUF1573 domain-containing protein [Crocinitomix catalasitica]|uniref:DUF1573 domain-containing protein n=1 Tax=Crocinitomix catalasitica TaxID=184607 RepID=UPI0004886125|nr:DUF1573 domain-containing protein [Crocinitomix catalasitica]
MKRIAFFSMMLVCFAFMSNTTMAQGGVAVGGTTDGPQISVDKEVHDYGVLAYGADGKCEFKVTNTGNAPLIISKCKGSCGCTVPTCTQEPIAPGQSTMIKVEYDTKKEGPITKSVTISSNAVNEPSKTVRVKGAVKAKPAVTTTP